MKTSSVMKPAMLFAAGTIASSAASAAPTVMDVNFEATTEGTQIALAGSSTAQYNFQIRPKEGFEFAGNHYYIDGLDGAQVTNMSENNAFYPSADDPRLGSSVKTGSEGGVAALVAADKYYGLRFAANGTNYTGFAGVNQAGNVITQIGYQAAAGVPEPSTWALMIAGFGGVGLAMRRRRRQAPAVAVA